MIAIGCSSTSWGTNLSSKYRKCSSRSLNLVSRRTIQLLPAKAEFLCSSRNSSFPIPNPKCQASSADIHPCSLFFASTPLFKGEQCSMFNTTPKLPQRRKSLLPARAAKDGPKSFRYPPMTKKPRWWWRTLACFPYLLPLHGTWMYTETTYHIYPFFEDFEQWTYPFFRALGSLPKWFLMAYFFVAYLGIVRRKEWPHFLRFHLVNGMLLEITMQVFGKISRGFPTAVYWGKIGQHAWLAIACAYFFTVCQCMWCALAGMYADIPFVCDAAYIQIPYD